MFEQSAGWNEYYRELQPSRRREMLEALCASEPDDGANAFRRRLFEARHVDARRPGREVDRLLFICMNFIQIYQSARIIRAGAVREARRTLGEMPFDEAGAYGEAGARALYWEIRNAVARYLSTCQNPAYNRGLFGLVASSEKSREDRICRDMWQMSAGVTRRTGLESELRLWNRAVLDAYSATGEGARARFEAMDQGRTVR